MTKAIAYPHTVRGEKTKHFVGVAYAAATINHPSGHTRRYNTFVLASQNPGTYHVDMHSDAPDPPDPTSPSTWG